MKTTSISGDGESFASDRSLRQKMILSLAASANLPSLVLLKMTASRAIWFLVMFSLEEVQGRRHEYLGS